MNHLIYMKVCLLIHILLYKYYFTDKNNNVHYLFALVSFIYMNKKKYFNKNKFNLINFNF